MGRSTGTDSILRSLAISQQQLLLLLLQLQLLSLHVLSGHLHPIVVVPGTGASRIYARLTDAYRSSNESICGENWPAGWFRLWMNGRLLREPLVQCFAEQMAIHYDAAVDDYRNTLGVDTAVPHFGSVEGFRHRDPDNMKDSPDMAALLDRLEAAGYRDGQDLFGAPYDYRYGLAATGHPSHVGSHFLDNLKALVEHAASTNGGKPVVILSHSLGCLFTHQLLVRNTPSWRQRFVKHLIAVAGPWAGTVIAMRAYASGLAMTGLDPLVLRAEVGTYESNQWLLPSPRVFGGRPLVVTARRNYSAADLPEFLANVGFPEAVHPYRSRILPMIARWDPPGVPVTCISGSGIPTPEVVAYRDGFDRVSDVVLGDGDGEVNMESLVAAAAEWSGMAEQPVKVIKVANATHESILVNGVTWREIMERVSSCWTFSPILVSTKIFQCLYVLRLLTLTPGF